MGYLGLYGMGKGWHDVCVGGGEGGEIRCVIYVALWDGRGVVGWGGGGLGRVCGCMWLYETGKGGVVERWTQGCIIITVWATHTLQFENI